MKKIKLHDLISKSFLYEEYRSEGEYQDMGAKRRREYREFINKKNTKLAKKVDKIIKKTKDEKSIQAKEVDLNLQGDYVTKLFGISVTNGFWNLFEHVIENTKILDDIKEYDKQKANTNEKDNYAIIMTHLKDNKAPDSIFKKFDSKYKKETKNVRQN